MIYVVGDSHALCGFYNVSPFAVLHLGPRTARMLPEHHHDLVMSALNMIPPGSKIIFVFGGIDCMHHINRDWMQSSKTVYANIEETTSVYIRYVAMLRSCGFLIYPLSISPPGETDSPNMNAESLLVDIVARFNNRLGEKAIPLDVPFINVHHFLIGDDGIREKKYIKDSIHLNENLGIIVAREFFQLQAGYYNA